ncbi:MAG TPA: transglutaminase-like domain-containing protein, partial [Candidatus Polarisedimenticolia bacterium]|nr:transglutaminase-like domain-containing protein [Candidatus Polarisedimenticolia bacterium]
AAPAAANAPVPKETAPSAPRQRLFNLNIRYVYNSIPKNLVHMDYWFPYPPAGSHQSLHNLVVNSAYAMNQDSDPETGNIFMHMEGGARGGVPMQVSFRMDVERREIRNESPAPSGQPPGEEELKALRDRWLAPERMTPVTREVRSRASKATSGRRRPLDKARAIYEYVIENVVPIDNVSEVRGAGYGNLEFVLRELKGDAVDMAAAFVGLCRAEGIPARTVMGMKIPTGIKTGKITGYHGWAEFYIEGIGWLPADPFEGARHEARRGYYFGSLDENRVAVSIGRDIKLKPAPKQETPLNFFINPYWEGDGREMPIPFVDVEFQELDRIPDPVMIPATESDAPPQQTPVPPPR